MQQLIETARNLLHVIRMQSAQHEDHRHLGIGLCLSLSVVWSKGRRCEWRTEEVLEAYAEAPKQYGSRVSGQ